MKILAIPEDYGIFFIVKPFFKHIIHQYPVVEKRKTIVKFAK